MIVGYGGSIPKLGQSGLWKYQKSMNFTVQNPETINDMDRFWEHPDYPRNKFRFDSCDYERNFLFAIATRYKATEVYGQYVMICLIYEEINVYECVIVAVPKEGE